jgi:hypothetical protein
MPPCQKQLKKTLKEISIRKSEFNILLKPLIGKGFEQLLFNVNEIENNRKAILKKEILLSSFVNKNEYFLLH